jgi:hypothetical protein
MQYRVFYKENVRVTTNHNSAGLPSFGRSAIYQLHNEARESIISMGCPETSINRSQRTERKSIVC